MLQKCNAKLSLLFFQEGVWKWSDGKKFDFNGWHKGEPNNSGGAENCMEINFRGKNPLSVVLLMESVHNIQDGKTIPLNLQLAT